MNVTRSYYGDIIGDPSIRLAFLISYVVLAAIGGLGNGAVIYLLLPVRGARIARSNLLIISLGVCDFITCAFTIPFLGTDVVIGFSGEKGILTPAYCDTGIFIALFITTVKFHIVTLISLERYILICHPFKSRKWLSVNNIIKALCVIVPLAFCLALPFPAAFAITGVVNLEGTELVFCAWMVALGGKYKHWHVYYLFLFLFYYLIPVCVMVYAYCSILKQLYRSNGVLSAHVAVSKIITTRRTVAKLMLSVAIIFTVLHSPYTLLLLAFSFGAALPQKNGIFLLMCMSYLTGLNSAINPFIYCSYAKIFFRRKILSLCKSNEIDREDHSNVTACTRF